MRRRRSRTTGRLRQRMLSALLLSAFLAADIGFPLPAILVKNGSHAFPCAYHQCGCQTAAQCERACCCFTPDQRLAWSGLLSDVPAADSAVSASHDCCDKRAISLAENTLFESSSLARPAAVIRVVTADLSTPEPLHAGCCAHDHADRAVVGSTTESEDESEAELPCFAPSHCRGSNPVWTLLTELFPPLPHGHEPGAAVVCDWVESVSDQAENAAQLPPLPPPRA